MCSGRYIGRKRGERMAPQNVREILIERTISVIANEGLDKTTTKAITLDTGINESYIYRNFVNKEDLLSKVFDTLDREFVDKVMQHVLIMRVPRLGYEQRCRILFGAVWRFILGNREKCLTFIRYYYSPYFMKFSYARHKKRYASLVRELSNVFAEDANVWMILGHILNVMLDFAAKVFMGAVENNDNTTEHVFRMVYCSIQPYLRKIDKAENKEDFSVKCQAN